MESMVHENWVLERKRRRSERLATPGSAGLLVIGGAADGGKREAAGR